MYTALNAGKNNFTNIASTTILPFSVRDRVRTKLERDILVDVNHPFIVKLHYGELLFWFFESNAANLKHLEHFRANEK